MDVPRRVIQDPAPTENVRDYLEKLDAAVAILSFQGTWNSFFWPLVILQVKQHWTLPLGLTQFRFLYSTNWPPLMAVTVIATIPIVILYVFFQRYFVGGGISAAVKG